MLFGRQNKEISEEEVKNKNKWAELVTCKGKKVNVYCVLVGKPEGKTKFGMSRHTRENNIKIYLKEIT